MMAKQGSSNQEHEPALEKVAEQVRQSSEAHMGETHKDDKARKAAKAESKAADAHLEVTHHKHNKGRPPTDGES